MDSRIDRPPPPLAACRGRPVSADPSLSPAAAVLPPCFSNRGDFHEKNRCCDGAARGARFAAPAAQAEPILSWVELAFKSSVDGVVYGNQPWDPWVPPAGADLSGFNAATGFGTIRYTFNTPGTHWVAGLFDYQFVDVANFKRHLRRVGKRSVDPSRVERDRR